MSENVPSFLIVDDSPSIREIAGLFISSEYENPITYAPDGELALEEIKKAPENILAVISDDNMPILTGSQLYDHLRKDYDPRLPFLLISWDPYGFEKETPQSREDKNFGVVTKPFLKRTLLTHLSLLLSEKSHSLITNPEEYRMISIPHFLSFNTLTVSVFIKLSAEKFVKVANPENKSYKAILVPYQEKGIQSVYLLNHDYEQFLEGAIDQINANFKNDSLKRVKMLSLQKESVTKIHEGLATLGIKEKKY